MTQHSSEQQELQLWHAPEVYWPIANRIVRVVKTVRTQRKNRIRVRLNEAGRRRPQKEMVVEQSNNFYASNLELGTIPPVFVHQLGRSRWVIDTEVFQTIHHRRPPQKPIRASGPRTGVDRYNSGRGEDMKDKLIAFDDTEVSDWLMDLIEDGSKDFVQQSNRRSSY